MRPVVASAPGLSLNRSLLPSPVPSALIAGGAAARRRPARPRAAARRRTDRAGRGFGFPEPDLTVGSRGTSLPGRRPGRAGPTPSAPCRDGCSRRHEGQDLMARSSAAGGVPSTARSWPSSHGPAATASTSRTTTAGTTRYLHINNDTPVHRRRRNPIEWAFAPGIAVGSRVRRGQHIAYVGDSGNAESTGPHCHFEIRKPGSGVWTRRPSTRSTASTQRPKGARPSPRRRSSRGPLPLRSWVSSTPTSWPAIRAALS